MLKKFDGNTILLNISEENDKHRWLYISGDKVFSFLTKGHIYKYISKMGKNLIPYSNSTGGEYIYFLTPHFKFIKREMINKNELLNTNERSVDAYDLLFFVSRCGENSFKKLKIYKFHASYN